MDERGTSAADELPRRGRKLAEPVLGLREEASWRRRDHRFYARTEDCTEERAPLGTSTTAQTRRRRPAGEIF